MFPHRVEVAYKDRGADLDLPTSVSKVRARWVPRGSVVFGPDDHPSLIDDGVFCVIESVASDDLLFSISAHPENWDACFMHLVCVVAGFFGDSTYRDTFKEDANIHATAFGLDHGVCEFWVGEEVNIEKDLLSGAFEALDQRRIVVFWRGCHEDIDACIFVSLGSKQALAGFFDAVGDISAQLCGGETVVPIRGGVGIRDRDTFFISVAGEDLSTGGVGVCAAHIYGWSRPVALWDRACVEGFVLCVFDGVITNDVDRATVGVMKRDNPACRGEIRPTFGEISFGDIGCITVPLDIGGDPEHAAESVSLVSDPDGLSGS